MHVAFAEYPSNLSLTYPLETVAAFQCRHESGARVDWQINGSYSWNFVDLDITTRHGRDNGTILNTISITVTPEHNGTQVACEVSNNEGSEVSPNATLTVYIEGLLDITLLYHKLICLNAVTSS